MNVSNTSGRTDLIIDGTRDRTGSVTISDHEIKFANPDSHADINYSGGRLGGRGVTNMTVVDGQGQNFVEVDSV